MSSSTTVQDRVKAEAITALERLGGELFREEDYLHQGNQLVVPENMTLEECWRYVRSLAASYEEAVDFSRVYKYKPWDVALNAYLALKEHFGSTRVSGTQSFFGVTPPRMIDVAISPTETVQVPWGQFSTPFLPDVVFTFGSLEDPEYGMVGVIYAAGPKKRSSAVQGVFELVERQLKTGSIYRGKAFTAEENPRFVDVDIDPDKVVFAADTQAQIEANIFAPIRYRSQLEQLGQSTKRAVLVYGDFGVGKSLAIGLTAQEAVSCGWTAIIVRPGRDNITDAFRTARMYGPAVICVEDVDTIADASKEVDEISHILELFDGVESKNQKVMVVLTTNHIEKLHKGMVRPGRLDAIIPIGAPDAAGIRKLVEVNMPEGMLAAEIDWEAVSESMQGFLPAFCVEAATRAVRYATVRTAGQIEQIVLQTEDLVFSALGLRGHLDLMNEAATGTPRPSLDEAMGRVIERNLDSRVLAANREVD